jgi:hypothetical protein
MLSIALTFFGVGACDCGEQLISLQGPAPTRADDDDEATAPEPGTDAGPSDPGDDAGVAVDAGAADDPDAGVFEPTDAGPEPAVDAGFAEPTDAGILEPPPDEVPVYDGPCGPVVITPAHRAELWGEFQSVPGTSYQVTVSLTFPCPVRSVTVTIFDPDFVDNAIIANGEGGVLLDRALFIGDNTPGVPTSNTQSVQTDGEPIVEVLLQPDPLDFVSYGDVSYTAY